MKLTRAVMAGMTFAFCAATASAQDYPSQPVRLIVPFAPGGPADAIGRIVGQRLSEVLDQPIVHENRGGAGGVIGTDMVAKGRPDGYLIAMTSAGALAISASMQADVPYDNSTDFTPVTLLASVPELLVGRGDLPVSSLDELIELARNAPGTLNFASSGPGSMPHLAGELLNISAGIDMVHIPYTGAGPAVTDLLGGQVDVMFADAPVLLPHVTSGALKALAVGSAERASVLPDLPTLREAGLEDVTAENWYGIVAPAGLPQAELDILHAAIMETLADPAVVDALAAIGVAVEGSTPAEFTAYIAAETAKWAGVVEQSGAGLR